MARVITFGEIMLRLSPPNSQRFIQAQSFDACYGGGEANVAISLANYGHESYYITKVPDNEIGQAAINALRRYGVNTDYIARGGKRLGIYFLEPGASMRPSKVIYDRSYSSISEASLNDFNFKEIFKDAKWFHFTGITPALNDNVAKILEQALVFAKQNNVIVSVDLNYRKKLWTVEKARSIMKQLMQYVDVCIGNEEDYQNTLGITPLGSEVEKGVIAHHGYQSLLEQVHKQYNLTYAAVSLRHSYSASRNGWEAMVYDGNEVFQSNKYDIEIVDRVGSGDSFAGGLIHGLLSYGSLSEAFEFATAASALKHTIPGDFNLVSEAEVLALVKGNKSGRIER